MACVIDATVGGTSANSYSSIAEADDYQDTRPAYAGDTTWESAGDDDKCRALVTATRMLDTWFEWAGVVSTLTQRLLWPRRGVLKPGIADETVKAVDNPWGEPFAILIDPTTIPDRIKEATAELARQLLVSDRSADSDIETQGIRALRAGPVSIDFENATTKPIPDAVMALVAALGRPRTRSGAGAVTLYRA